MLVTSLLQLTFRERWLVFWSSFALPVFSPAFVRGPSPSLHILCYSSWYWYECRALPPEELSKFCGFRTSEVTSLLHECRPADSAPSLWTPFYLSEFFTDRASLSYSHMRQTFESKGADFCLSSVLIIRGTFVPAVPLKHWANSCLTLLE